MLGPLVNGAAIALGGVLGSVLGHCLPSHVKEKLLLTGGLASAGIGVALMNKVSSLPAVALALLLGSLIGELLFLERGLERAVGWCQQRIEQAWPSERESPQAENFVAKFVTVLVLFSSSSMGIFGAMREGMTGDASILLAKAVLDLFAAILFAAELGSAVALVALPQISIQAVLYFAATLLLPLISPSMLGDFSACGGIIMLATGLRICGIKMFPIVNMLPALFLTMPCSALWSRFFG